MKNKHPDWPHQLVIVGKEGWGEAAKPETADSEIAFTGYVNDGDLPALYAGSSVFAYPSLYEGFGLPIIEAMASGTAVITSNYGAMQEVAGDAAALINPLSTDDMARALENLLDSTGAIQSLRKKGKVHAAQFTVAAQAHATLNVYQRVLGASK